MSRYRHSRPKYTPPKVCKKSKRGPAAGAFEISDSWPPKNLTAFVSLNHGIGISLGPKIYLLTPLAYDKSVDQFYGSNHDSVGNSWQVICTHALFPSTKAFYEIHWTPSGGPAYVWESDNQSPLTFVATEKKWHPAIKPIPWTQTGGPTHPKYDVAVFDVYVKGNP